MEEMSSPEPKKHGGRRPGAGRKAKPVDMRQATGLFLFDGRSIREAAKRLGVSARTLQRRMRD